LKVSFFQTILAFAFQASELFPSADPDTFLISSSKQLKRTAQPVKELSKMAAMSGLERMNAFGSSLDNTKAWIREREAPMTLASEDIATMLRGALLYLLDRS
jgi:hypothetical protein